MPLKYDIRIPRFIPENRFVFTKVLTKKLSTCYVPHYNVNASVAFIDLDCLIVICATAEKLTFGGISVVSILVGRSATDNILNRAIGTLNSKRSESFP